MNFVISFDSYFDEIYYFESKSHPKLLLTIFYSYL